MGPLNSSIGRQVMRSRIEPTDRLECYVPTLSRQMYYRKLYSVAGRNSTYGSQDMAAS